MEQVGNRSKLFGLATHYNYFRDYDPAIGRYVQSDPLGLRAGPTTYGYVKGSPLRWTDRLGLLTCGSGPNEPVVPDNPLGFAFSRCCANHDGCYSDCANQPTKAECDSRFYRCMMKVCSSYSGVARWVCTLLASGYFTAVDRMGHGPYLDARP